MKPQARHITLKLAAGIIELVGLKVWLEVRDRPSYFNILLMLIQSQRSECASMTTGLSSTREACYYKIIVTLSTGDLSSNDFSKDVIFVEGTTVALSYAPSHSNRNRREWDTAILLCADKDSHAGCRLQSCTSAVLDNQLEVRVVSTTLLVMLRV